GLAYVSYNTYPGWHMRGVLRSILVDAVPHDAPTGERVRIARAVARQVATDAEHFEGFGERLAGHARELLDYEDHYLAHDHLELENHPLWFREFLDLAARHGLQFVDDLEVSPNVAPSDLHGLQYVDRISGVTFRASVLCAADVELEDGRSPAGLAQLFVAGPLRPEGTVEMDEGVPATILGLKGKSLQTSSRAVKLFARSISATWPQSRPVEALIADVVDEVGSGGPDASAIRHQLLDTVLNLHRRRAVELETQPYPFTRQISARPIVSAGNRWAAEAGELLTGGRHDRHRLDRFAAFVASRLDGSRTVPDLVDDVVRAGEDGTLSFSDADDSQLRGTDLRAAADETVPEVLRHLASIGLLVG
ncbi:MAG TPA: methyltransferase regulatory domain-containing protein, partial [Ilumatobacter sp.]